MWSATMDVAMSCLIPGAPPALLKRPSHLAVGYLRQDPQSGIHGCLPILLFSQPFSLCPNFLRPVSLESTHVPLSLNSVVPSHPLTFCSTCSDLLGVLPGTCFPTYDLVHPSEIKHSPVFWGLPLPSWPRFRFDLGLRGPRACLIAQLVKNPPAMQETWVRSLGSEYPLEKGMATHSSILAWRIPWTI